MLWIMDSMTLPVMESLASFLKRKGHLLITLWLVLLQFLRYVQTCIYTFYYIKFKPSTFDTIPLWGLIFSRIFLEVSWIKVNRRINFLWLIPLRVKNLPTEIFMVLNMKFISKFCRIQRDTQYHKFKSSWMRCTCKAIFKCMDKETLKRLKVNVERSLCKEATL